MPSSCSEKSINYLITFAQKHEDFRMAELEAVLIMQGLNPDTCLRREAYRKDLPYLVASFPSEAAASAVCDRAILIKSIMELWGEASRHDELAAAIQTLPDAFVNPHLSADVSWSVTVDAFGMSMSLDRQEEVRAHYRHLAFQGPVRCKGPDQMFWAIEQHTPLPTGQVAPNSIPEKVYFGREVGRSLSRQLVTRCDLKQRKYLGPTSMDNELSLVMANMGLVRKGSVVLDPFVGTGSILVACANFGAFCFGTDIDTRVLRGKCDNNIFSNFDQYNLVAPEVVRCDVSMYSRHFRRVTLYDAIVCDPPYGIRAGARKAGNRHGADKVRPVPAELRGVHIPQTQPYPVEDVLVDLLNLAAESLVLKGRLVFLLPTTYDFCDADLPQHPCLTVVANSEQPLNQKMGRRLITMEKVRDFQDSDRAAYAEVATSSASRPFSMLREKMQGDSLAGSLDRRDAKRQKIATPPAIDDDEKTGS